MKDYEALKAYGHSPMKALEITLDAQRGDDFAKKYIAMVQGSADQLQHQEDQTSCLTK